MVKRWVDDCNKLVESYIVAWDGNSTTTGRRVLHNSEKIDDLTKHQPWQSSYRKINNKGCPFTHFGFDGDEPTMPVDNGVTYRKAES